MSDNRELKHVGRQRDDDGNQYNESMKRNKSLKSWGGWEFQTYRAFQKGRGHCGKFAPGTQFKGGAPNLKNLKKLF
jgi:hypothetical protein